jgi:hypothetical protein
MKKCSKCKIEKDLLLFNKNKSEPDGYNHYCKECKKACDAIYRSKNREKMIAYLSEYYKNNKQKFIEYAAKNKDKIKVNRKSHPCRQIEYTRKYNQKYRESNKDKRAAWENNRRATKLNASPSWANEFFIEEIYNLAKLRTKLTGLTWHVDHIIPLKNKIVCGLHCEANLQVILASENLRKHNKYDISQ